MSEQGEQDILPSTRRAQRVMPQLQSAFHAG